MSITRNGSIMVQGASASGILNYAYGGTSANIAPTTAGNVLFTSDGTNWSSAPNIVRGTAVNSTSGTSIDFTSIPSWVKRVTVMFNAVSTSGTSLLQVQLGSGSVTTTGYLAASAYITTAAAANATATSGFIINQNAANYSTQGSVIFSLLSSNTWVAQGVLYQSTAIAYTIFMTGSIALSGSLDRVRLTTVNGTDTFDAGSVNILYE